MKGITDSAKIGDIMMSLIEWHQEIQDDQAEILASMRNSKSGVCSHSSSLKVSDKVDLLKSKTYDDLKVRHRG